VCLTSRRSGGHAEQHRSDSQRRRKMHSRIVLAESPSLRHRQERVAAVQRFRSPSADKVCRRLGFDAFVFALSPGVPLFCRCCFQLLVIIIIRRITKSAMYIVSSWCRYTRVSFFEQEPDLVIFTTKGENNNNNSNCHLGIR